MKEVYNAGYYNQMFDKAYNFTRQLDWYKDRSVTTSSYSSAKKYDSSNSSEVWWLRTSSWGNSDGTHYFMVVHSAGVCWQQGAISSKGVSPAFRIA